MDCIVHGILQARILEWVAFPSSRGSSQPRNRTGVSCIAGGSFTNWAISEAIKRKQSRILTSSVNLACEDMTSFQVCAVHASAPSCLSHVQPFATPWTVACQVPFSMGSSKQEYWSGLPLHTPRDLPNPRIKPISVSCIGWQEGSLP